MDCDPREAQLAEHLRRLATLPLPATPSCWRRLRAGLCGQSYREQQAFNQAFAEQARNLAELLAAGLTQLRTEAQERAASTESQRAQLQGELERLRAEQQAAGQELRGQAAWTALLQTKLDRLALDVREAFSPQASETAPDAAPEPRVLNPAKLQAMQREPAGLRLNLGCGEQPRVDYLNVDAREMPGVDILADVRQLPLPAGSVQELFSAHLVEHFREHQLRRTILPYWKSLLRPPDGRLRIVCPDWEAMLLRLREGTLSLAEFKKITFGAQDYVGDDHFCMFTAATLTALLQEAGFTRIDVVAQGRLNGICPELELTAAL